MRVSQLSMPTFTVAGAFGFTEGIGFVEVPETLVDQYANALMTLGESASAIYEHLRQTNQE